MTRTCLALAVAFLSSACAADDLQPGLQERAMAPRSPTTGLSDTTDSSQEGPESFPDHLPVIELDPGFANHNLLSVSVSSWMGRGIGDAEMCTVEGCVAVDGVLGSVSLPEGEVTVTVRGEDTVERHLQLVGGGSAHITVPTIDEADGLAAAVGVVREPGLGTLIQYVDSPAGVRPRLSVEADGPYFLYGGGTPQPAGEPLHAGYYVYFNVPAGLHSVELPGCDEGDGFWGAPSDGAIDLQMAADAWLGLAPIDCAL